MIDTARYEVNKLKAVVKKQAPAERSASPLRST